MSKNLMTRYKGPRCLRETNPLNKIATFLIKNKLWVFLISVILISIFLYTYL